MPKHYLITGGAGFIGSHLAERLIKDGNKITIFDDFNDYYD
ncbi:MAG: GDP-mannose 4,6-dehydratase, partial [Akkermansiaceae bacterium]